MQQELFNSAQQTFQLANADIHYLPDFVANSKALYAVLLNELAWRQDSMQMYGKTVKIPRLNAWYGERGTDYSYSGIQLSPQPWTPTLLELKQRVERHLQCSFNSVLANYYRDEKDSVAWHADDERELGERPVIASLSFGATRRFSLKPKLSLDSAAVHTDLASGSLLVMAGNTQQQWLHQVPKTSQVVGGRINLTFRRIISHRG